MNYRSYDLKQRSKGEVVEVTISGNAPNVRLLDATNYRSYKAGRKHRYYGGHAKTSPVRLTIPHSGHWFVVIDFGGYAGRARTGVQVLPGRLPNLRPSTTMPSLPSSLFREPDPRRISSAEAAKAFDVFISHASEDKEDVVRPLAHALIDEGLEVWYDEFELMIGDSLRQKIDAGIARSRFGVVVLSEDFFRKGWPNYELDGLVTRGVAGEQVLLPIWHKLTHAEVMAVSPSLAGKVARSTAEFSVEEIASEIAARIRRQDESAA